MRGRGVIALLLIHCIVLVAKQKKLGGLAQDSGKTAPVIQ